MHDQVRTVPPIAEDSNAAAEGGYTPFSNDDKQHEQQEATSKTSSASNRGSDSLPNRKGKRKESTPLLVLHRQHHFDDSGDEDDTETKGQNARSPDVEAGTAGQEDEEEEVLVRSESGRHEEMGRMRIRIPKDEDGIALPAADEEGADRGATGGSSRSVASLPTSAPLISPRKTQKRAIFVDWIRSIAVFVVVFVHIFVSIQRVAPPTPQQEKKIEGSFRVVLQYGMPMFFYFSGRSTAYSKAPMIPFVISKFKRLLLPCVVGLFLVVIPTCYIGRSYRPCGEKDVNNFFMYYKSYFTTQISCNGLDWYWFLPVLAALSIVNQFFLSWLKLRYRTSLSKGIMWRLKDDAPPLAYIVCLCGVLIGVAAGIGAPVHIFLLFMSTYFILYAFVIFMAPIQKAKLLYVLYLAAPLPSIILGATVHDSYSGNSPFAKISSQFLMVLFYNFFYIEGYIDEVFDDDWKKWRDNSKTHASIKPFALLFLIIFMAIGAPSTDEDAGYLYTYPLYKRTWYVCATYVIGTWLWLMIWVRYGETFYNDILNSFEYTHVTTSSFLVYLTHWFFIDLIQVLIIKPAGMSLIAGVAILIPLVSLCCGGLYVGLIYLERAIAGCTKSKKKGSRATEPTGAIQK